MKNEKKYRWHKIADTESDLNFAPNNLLQIEVAGKIICIARGKELFACTAKCPHAGGSLVNGYLDALGNIVCPLHRYKFSIENGRNISGEGYFLKRFLVEINSEGIFIRLEENKSFF